MKSLVIAPQPFFTPRGTPFSVYYRTLVMSELGVQVDLLTYGDGEDVEIPNVRIIRIPRLKFLGPAKIGPSPVKAVLDVLMLIWTIGLLLCNRYDYVHAHEESVFWCRFLKPIFRFKLAYDMHSSLSQQLTNFHFTKSQLLIGLFKKLEDAALHRSEAVITICPDLRDYVLMQGIDPKRHFLIENSIFDDVQLHTNDSAVQAAASKPLVDKNGSQRIVYAGTFEPYQGLEILIRGFAQLAKSHPQTQLVMVGGTEDQVRQMRELANQCSLNGSCVFTGRVPKSQAMAYLKTADVLVSPRKEGTNTPLKVYEQLASGKPLVATNIWSHTQVLTDEVCFLVDPTPEAMANGLTAAITDSAKAMQVAAAGRALYETAYSRSAYEQKMRGFLDVLAKGSG